MTEPNEIDDDEDLNDEEGLGIIGYGVVLLFVIVYGIWSFIGGSPLEEAIDPRDGTHETWRAFQDEGGIDKFSDFYGFDVNGVHASFRPNGKILEVALTIYKSNISPAEIRELMSDLCEIADTRWEMNNNGGKALGEDCFAIYVPLDKHEWKIVYAPISAEEPVPPAASSESRTGSEETNNIDNNSGDVDESQEDHDTRLMDGLVKKAELFGKNQAGFKDKMLSFLKDDSKNKKRSDEALTAIGSFALEYNELCTERVKVQARLFNRIIAEKIVSRICSTSNWAKDLLFSYDAIIRNYKEGSRGDVLAKSYVVFFEKMKTLDVLPQSTLISLSHYKGCLKPEQLEQKFAEVCPK